MPAGFVVNLKDIAREAGVSVSTVSRVMKGKGEIAPETRNRIMAISKKMGYHENRFSKAIRTGKTGLVGVIMDYMDPFFGQITKSIEQILRQNDFLPVILSCNQEEAQGLFHRLVEQRVDGMILVPPCDTADNEFFHELSQCGIPIVTMDREIPADVSFVGTDDYAGGWMNAEYFYHLGHRKLGYYSGPPQASSAALRKKDFRISAAPMQTASIFNSEPNGGMRIRMNVSAIFCSAIRKSPASAPFTIPMRCSSDVWPKTGTPYPGGSCHFRIRQS